MRLTNTNAETSLLWNNFVILLSITILCLPTSTWALSDKRLCADPKCERIISFGTTKINYAAPEKGMLSFKINSSVRVLSKSAGSDKNLWGVEINGRRGYVNKDFIMETRITIPEKLLEYEVPVGIPDKPAERDPVASVTKPQDQPMVHVDPPVAKGIEQQDQTASKPVASSPQKLETVLPANDKLQEHPVVNAESNGAKQPEQPVVAAPVLPIPQENQAAESIAVIAKQQEQPVVNAQPAVTKLPGELVDNAAALPNTKEQRLADALPLVAKPAEQPMINAENADKLLEQPVVNDAPVAAKAQDQPMLNSSESADDTMATTTSPLEVEVNTDKPIILTAQDTLKSSGVPTPTAHKAQIVDGTELESEPATVKPTESEKKQQLGAANETKIEDNTLYDDTDDDFDYNEDEGEDDSLDSEENEVLNRMASEKGIAKKEEEPIENMPTKDEHTTNDNSNADTEKTLELEVMSAQNKITVAKTLTESDVKNDVNKSQTNDALQETVKDKPADVATEPALHRNENISIVKENTNNDQQAPIAQTPSENPSQEPPKPLSIENIPLSTLKAATPDEIEIKPVQTKIEQQRPETQNAAKVPEVQQKFTSDHQMQMDATNLNAQAGNAPELVVQTAVNSESTATSLPELPSSLPPLIYKQQINNPNEYYKQLEQMQKQTTEATQQEAKIIPHDQHQYVNDPKWMLETQHTTVSYDSPYDSFNEAEVTPAPTAQAVLQDQKGAILEREFAAEVPQQQTAAILVESVPQIPQEQKAEIPLAESVPGVPQQQTAAIPLAESVPQIPQEQKAAIPLAELVPREQKAAILLAESVPEVPQEQKAAIPLAELVPEVPQAQEAATQVPDSAAQATETSTDVPATEKAVETATGTGSAMLAEPVALPSTSSPILVAEPLRDDSGLGLFATIVGTVNSFISSQKKEPETSLLTGSEQLQRRLYPDSETQKSGEFEYCTRSQPSLNRNCHASISLDNFVEVLAAEVINHSQLLLCVVIAAASSLFFMFVYYCFCNSSQEGALLSKLNMLERSLLTAHKENLILKHDLGTTRTKLSSIEDNSFGSNDMVAALKRELETELCEKAKLQEQVNSLEKDLDNAAEAGLELNKMLSEVLSNQSGEDAFMTTVEELQRQLDDQEKIIIDINSSLAEKSRENSELQYSFTESNARLAREMKALQQDNYELEMEKSKLKTRVDEIEAEAEQGLAKALEARNYEMQRLQKQILELTGKWEKEHDALQTSLAKIEALEDCLTAVNKSGNINMQELIASTKTRGELNAAQNKFLALQEKLEKETEAKTRLENQLQSVIGDIEKLKQEFNHSERDKLEAQTRLEVLSSYFREKESQLQKELSQQEAKWLQHYGENTTTVETQTLMKNEIQALKSQNDELRAEIEAQIASHKAQMGTLENRAHESWLSARQFERRCEEALTEAAGLRRKLTAIANGNVPQGQLSNGGPDGQMGVEPKGPSPLPLPLPQPGSPLLSMPNHLPFLAPFMGLPPPFLPPAPGVARPPPLGRMRSPPPSMRGDRYHQQRDDYSDYDDYDDDDDDDRGMDRHRRHSGSWGRRDSCLQSPRTYRSLSPSDSRYNYNDTETDFSPPPSPSPPRNGSSRPIEEV